MSERDWQRTDGPTSVPAFPRADARLASEDARWCPKCGHAIEYHGENGCDVEVRDYGQLDCGCMYGVALPSPSGPSEDARVGCERHRGDPHNLCPECWKAEGALPSPSGPDAETLEATVRQALRGSAAGEGWDPAPALSALSGLVALVEQRERERDDAQRVLEIAAKKAHEEFDRRVAAEALLARHRQALEDARALYERVEMDESVGRCLSDRGPSLRLGASLADLAASAPGTEEPA